eukprot:scaffold99238_cov22-Tisochrysis_lutea.AAC.1
MAQRLASNAANPTILWLVSRGSAVGVGLGMIQRYGAEVEKHMARGKVTHNLITVHQSCWGQVAKANKEYQELQVLVKDIDKDLSFTFQALAKKGGVTMPEPIKESIEHLIGVLHNCARKLKVRGSSRCVIVLVAGCLHAMLAALMILSPNLYTGPTAAGYGKWLVKKLWGMSNTKEIGEMRSQLKDAKIKETAAQLNGIQHTGASQMRLLKLMLSMHGDLDCMPSDLVHCKIICLRVSVHTLKALSMHHACACMCDDACMRQEFVRKCIMLTFNMSMHVRYVILLLVLILLLLLTPCYACASRGASTEEVPETDAEAGVGARSAASCALYNACRKGDAAQAQAQIKAGGDVDYVLE